MAPLVNSTMYLNKVDLNNQTLKKKYIYIYIYISGGNIPKLILQGQHYPDIKDR